MMGQVAPEVKYWRNIMPESRVLMYLRKGILKKPEMIPPWTRVVKPGLVAVVRLTPGPGQWPQPCTGRVSHARGT